MLISVPAHHQLGLLVSATDRPLVFHREEENQSIFVS